MPPFSPEHDANVYLCPHCGVADDAGGLFCENCGEERMDARSALDSAPGTTLDYCLLRIEEGRQLRFFYLCSRPEVWLGRSGQVEFQTLHPGYRPDELPNLRISARHLCLRSRGDHWAALDPGTLNGTRTMSGRALLPGESYRLQKQDCLSLAGVLKMGFQVYENAPSPERSGFLMDQKREVPDTGFRQADALEALKIFYLDPPDHREQFLLLNRVLYLGHSPANALSLPTLAGPRVARILLRTNGYLLERLDPGQAIMLDQRSLACGIPAPLTPGQVIALGAVRISLESP